MEHKTDRFAQSYIVVLELEIGVPYGKDKAPKWKHGLPGNRAGSTFGQCIIPDSRENRLIVGQRWGYVYCIEQNAFAH